MEILQRNGFDIEVWDFTPFINPVRYKGYVPPDTSHCNNYLLVHRKEEALLAIKKLNQSSFVVCLLAYEYKSYAMFRALSKYGIPYGLYSYNYPSFNIGKKSIINRFLNITPSKLIAHLFQVVPSKYLGISPASIVLVVGGEFRAQTFAVGQQTQVLWSHNYDYEIYMRLMKEPIQQDNQMGVFLDQAFPFHPDALQQPLFTPEDYYPRLCRFFDYLERCHGVRIVIAAHPRSQYEMQKILYGNRSVIRGRTAELVQESGFVIMHDSASINYAVLFKKPIIFITMNLLQKVRMGLIDFIASLLNKNVLNIDESYEIDLNGELVVNEKCYEEYLNKYIKKYDTDDTPAWQVFADHLKQQNERVV